MGITNYFYISQLPNLPGKWYVAWAENLGGVESDVLKWKLLEAGFKTGAYQVGIGKNVHSYRPKNPDMLLQNIRVSDDTRELDNVEIVEYKVWFVQWVNCEVWERLQECDHYDFTRHLFQQHRGHEVTGIVLETLDQAEQFVNEMEKRFTFYKLKEEYEQ